MTQLTSDQLNQVLAGVQPEYTALASAIAIQIATMLATGSGNNPSTGGGQSGNNGNSGNTGNTGGGNTDNPPKGTGEEVSQPTKLPFDSVPLKVNGRFLTLKSNKLIVKDKIVITLGNTQSVHVVGVQIDPSDTDGDLMIVTIDQDIDDPTQVVGRTASVQDRDTYEKSTNTGNAGSGNSGGSQGNAGSGNNNSGSSGNTGTGTTTPSTGTTTPSTGSGSTGSSAAVLEASVNSYNEGDWGNGTWQGAANKQGISLVSTPDAIASFTEGKEVTFVDGSKAKITYAQDLGDGKNLNIWFADGSKLDPKVGYPNKVKVAKVAGSTSPSSGSTGGSNANTGTATPVINVADTAKLLASIPKYDIISFNNAYKGQLFINLGMGAGGDSVLPGIHGRNYALPSEAEIKRAVSYGFKRFRVGFLWERAIKPGGRSELYRGKDSSGNNYTIEEMIRVGQTCKKYGATVKWDMHNYGGYSTTGSSANRKKVGSSGGPSIDVYANDWLAIINALKSDKDCWDATYGFDTMNEWESMTYAVVKAAGQKVLDVCAKTAEKKIFIFEGINYSSTTNWVQNNPDYYMLNHPLGKQYIEFSGHLYLDAGADGYYTEGDVLSSQDAARGWTHATVGLERIKGFANWCKANGVKGNIGENIVTGSMSKLMVGEAALLKFCYDSGIDVYIFGMGDWFGNNAHNIELEVNKPMLALTQAVCKLAA